MSTDKDARLPGESLSPRDELEALLPFYLNGTLDGADLAAVKDWLATDPAATQALEEAEAEFSGAEAANAAVRLPDDALARFEKALDAEAGPARSSAPSALARFWAGLTALPASFAWATAAAAIALVLVQTVMEPGGRSSGIEIAGTEGADMPFVLVTFKPEARLADVSSFLAGQGATILAGPVSGGVFKIGVPAKTVADYDRLVGLIAAQPFAETVLTGRKPENGG